MTDTPRPDHLGDEVLSAYLAGELDADAVADLEARLADDRDLARRLDATARVLAVLRGIDEVEPPAGAGERLRRRLADEAGPRVAPAGQGTGDDAAEDAAPAPVTTLASRRRVPWQAVAGIAAGLAAVALVGGGLLQGFGGGTEQAADDSADMATEAAEPDVRTFADSADEQAAGSADEDAAALAEEESAGDEGREGASAPPVPSTGEADGREDADGRAGLESSPQPTIRDERVVLAGAEDVRARYADRPLPSGLLGESLPVAEERAADARAAVAAAPPFRSGDTPGACLDEVAIGAHPSVPVLVESAVVDAGPAVVFLVVGATPDSAVLDRVEAQVLTLPGCVPVLSVDLT